MISTPTARAGEGAPAVRLSSEVSHENAASALVDKGRNAFALVLGNRGLEGLSGMLLGSVSLAVAARAGGPVVVVRGSSEHRARRARMSPALWLDPVPLPALSEYGFSLHCRDHRFAGVRRRS